MKLEITFLSDWHVGEGAGALGHIDRIVRRHPEDDLPFVPAKTLTGILRDACERVAHGLDDGSANGPWQNFVATLFGRQSTGTANTGHTTPALVRIGDGRFPENLRQALRQQQELKSALTFIKPGVKLDDEGVAQSRMLRMEEMVVTESQLSAELELDGYLDDATRRVALTLLAAGCRAVERLGAKRRRGHGRCQLTISGDPVVERPDWSLLDNDPPAITPPATASHLVLTPVTHAQPQGWHVLALDLTLLSPVVIPDGTAGNVIATRDHIPGALLLPALDKTLRQLLGERGHELTAHLAAGRVQIRNGYLCEGSERLLPAPLCLMAEKEHPGAIINELYGHRSDGIQRKQLRTGYLPVKGVARNGSEKSPVRNPDKIAATHAVIDDQFQRPTKTVGGVYTYEAIAPGQHFRAELWIDRAILQTLPERFDWPKQVRIGRAKKDGYGRVALEVSPLTREAVPENDRRGFTLWLASPLLARDERLRPILDAHVFTEWLTRQLGTPLTPLTPRNAFVRSQRDDGWNSAWKEPRITRFALAAGSCFHFEGEVSSAQLARLAEEGLGERRGEGYGEVAVNAPLIASGKVPEWNETGAKSNSNGTPASHSLPDTPFHRLLHQRAWRAILRRHALANARKYACDMGWNEASPPNSQLGALRSQFENWQGAASFKAWLDHLLATQNRKEKWPDKSLRTLQQQAESDDFVWRHVFNAAQLPSALPLEATKALQQEMCAEATRIFWLTVIAAEFDRRAERERQEQGQAELSTEQ